MIIKECILKMLKIFWEKVNNVTERHIALHKDIGDRKAIFYYRSFWNIIFRRKCNQYVVDIGDAKLVELFCSCSYPIETFIIHPYLRSHYFDPTLFERCFVGFFLTAIFYHISTSLIIIRAKNSIRL